MASILTALPGAPCRFELIILRFLAIDSFHTLGNEGECPASWLQGGREVETEGGTTQEVHKAREGCHVCTWQVTWCLPSGDVVTKE